ncbi:sporulation control protein [Halogeometricum borinquense DSM 11551]|uniref:Sporulation control protein n=1 Tax=Halogeometricum borinquense (strain ATCC 700274 / DSM 11551 / JCM 10706 / KCTC 4070 / PR3) TaxID=469382 RepID=E4NWJ2_HALBP|nr:sporulation protein [Halogeometricum borinquense]ADQ69412.1 sporulation control protein [Halogeometricum borinquense DSM 11551]ELY25964.1 sporulation control protein [Halogeometricum borinquense DSM 11551]
MKKILASVGIGNASVDTVLPSTTVSPGETVDAEVRVSGGDAEQSISAIDLEVETRYRTEEGYRDTTVGRMRLSESFDIEPGEETTYDAEITIPWETPLTLGSTEVWVETELEIDMAVDPEDVDYLDVQPTPRMQAVFDAAEELGFSLRTTECEADPYGRYVGGRRFVQEFEFRPSSGEFRGDVDEIELVFVPSASSLDVFVEVDRRGGIFSEALDVDERHTKFSLTDDNPSVASVRDRLREEIRANL